MLTVKGRHWGAGSASKALATWAWGPVCDPQHPSQSWGWWCKPVIPDCSSNLGLLEYQSAEPLSYSFIKKTFSQNIRWSPTEDTPGWPLASTLVCTYIYVETCICTYVTHTLKCTHTTLTCTGIFNDKILVYEPESGILPDMLSSSTSILNFLAFRTVCSTSI